MAPLPDGSEKVYVADDYSSGLLDWYSLDLDQGIASLGTVAGSGTTGLPPDAPFTLHYHPYSCLLLGNAEYALVGI